MNLLQKALDIDPEDHETNFNLGGYYLDQKEKAEQSVTYFEKAYESAFDDSERAKCLFNLAKAKEDIDP